MGEDNKYLALTSLLIIFLFSALAIYSISFVLPSLIAKYGEAVAFSIALSWIGGGIGGLVMGIFGDIRSKRYALLISIILFALPILANLIEPNIVFFYIIWFLIGFGVNAVNGISYVYVAELAPTKTRGFIGSIMQGFYFLGAILGLLISFVVRGNIFIYFLIISILSLISIPLWIFIPESKWRGNFSFKLPKDLIKVTIFGSLFSIGSFLFLVPLVSLSFTLFSFLGSRLYVVIFSAFILGMIGFMISGRVSDKIGRRLASYIFGIISIISSIILFVGAMLFDSILLIISFIVLMIGSSFFAYFGVWMSEVYPVNFKATGTNITLFLGRLIGGGFGVTLVLLMPFGLGRDLAISTIISSFLVLVSATQIPETVKRQL
ncbi:MFS transporter [Sulfolobus sp. A20]|uniref:MFS transporter n=1 Tax=Sulfolobaceae TaxID=118883 RepID=UPI0008460215|nr:MULTISPECIES: MFS transporter [unclassified Sulfolobus]TRM79203.1 MFS transporter [Sulfolobus sp. B5]TRM88601.1 MFS transporter [Sulfolobus sp. C3]TRN02969.1 MFS transporter [Sulfolobus sp. F1]TRN04242.1 MFS transporter [Sulfolobus sp. E1]AOL16259.1 MFS transporter [Sulfolobus sp. A20]